MQCAGDRRPSLRARGQALRVTAALAIAALTAGCFQPLYGEHSPTGGPVLRDQLSAVDIVQIEAPKGSDEARLAVEIRNALLYDFTGGGVSAPPTHRLKVNIYSTRATIIVDVNTSRSRRRSRSSADSTLNHGAASSSASGSASSR